MNDNATKPVRVGLLGCSDIARRKFLPALQGCAGALLSAVASRSPQKARAFAGGTGAAALDYGTLLQAQQVDLVYLSLPNHLHEEWALRALAAGKDVICEKPLGLSLASVERMLAAAEAHGRLLYENLMFLHHPQHAAVRALLDEGGIGRLLALRSVFCLPLPAPGNYRLDPGRGGGAFHDLARYPLATALHFLSGGLRGFRGTACDRGGLNLGMQGLALSETGEAFRFHVAFDRPYESFYEIVGERGSVRVPRAYTPPADLANRIEVVRDGGDASFTVPAADHFRLMLGHVCALVRGGRDFREAHARSRLLARLAEAMEKGCRDGD
jgi:predicted dehydrogenase